MFEGQNYKKQAREQLKKHWIEPILVTLILFVSFTTALISKVVPLVNIIYLTTAGICWIAISYFYLAFAKDNNNSTFNTFLQGCALWGKGIRGLLWNSLWVVLWLIPFIITFTIATALSLGGVAFSTLILAIPCIVKSIAYSQMFFIMAENPKIGVCKAMELSIEITDKHKGELFIMHLSFFGWAILSIITLGIGFLWLAPYYCTSFTYAYHYVKQDAIDREILIPADFESNEQISCYKS